jgi:hypothetical protein
MPVPDYKKHCTYQIFRDNLASLCKIYDIPLNHHDALRLQPFSSAHWGDPIRLETEIRAEPTGSCGRFAAFVRIPPENGTVRLVFCPQFFAEGTDGLRALTVLHEMVHVVAGPDECRAMAFAARVEQTAKGSFTPVDRYWRASGCDGSAYRLP